MSRWIAFDEESTAAAAALTQMAVLFQRGDAVAAALSSGKRALVVVPGKNTGDLLLLNVIRNSGGTPAAAPIAYEASGFLGLHDEPVFAEEPGPKKKWWQRILD